MALSSVGKELSNKPNLPTPLPFPPPAATIDRTMRFGEFLAESSRVSLSKIRGTSTSIQGRGILEQCINRMNIESGSYQAVESRREPNVLVPPRENWEIVLLPLLDSVTASCARFGDPLAPVPSRTKPCLHAPFTTNASQPNSTFFQLTPLSTTMADILRARVMLLDDLLDPVGSPWSFGNGAAGTLCRVANSTAIRTYLTRRFDPRKHRNMCERSALGRGCSACGCGLGSGTSVLASWCLGVD